MDRSMAATPIAKTKHSRYHRGGRFNDDQLDTSESLASPFNPADETPRRSLRTPGSSLRKSLSRTPRRKPSYLSEVSELDDEAGTTVTEFLNGSPTYSSSYDEDDDDPRASSGAFSNNVMSLFDGVKIPSFTNCVSSTQGVLESMSSKSPCIRATPSRTPRSNSRPSKGKHKKAKQRRKSTSALECRGSLRSPYYRGVRQGNDDFRVNVKRQEPNGVHFD